MDDDMDSERIRLVVPSEIKQKAQETARGMRWVPPTGPCQKVRSKPDGLVSRSARSRVCPVEEALCSSQSRS
jgi:hypothetical protein